MSAAIEAAAGRPFAAYMQTEVFDRLGLAHTTVDQNRRIIEDRSRFYAREDNGPVENAPYVDNSYKLAAGGLLSTPEDLVKFGSALLEPGYLNARSLAFLFTPQTTAAGEKTGYGMGWSIDLSKSGQRIYTHSGGSVGGRSRLILYPDLRLVVALVANLGEAKFQIEEVESIAEPFALEKKTAASAGGH